MKNLPALKASIAFASGISLGLWMSPPFFPILLICFILVIASLLIPSATFKSLSMFLAIFASGIVAFTSQQVREIVPIPLIDIHAIVEEPPLIRDGRYSFPATIILEDTVGTPARPLKTKVWVQGRGSLKPLLGQHLILHGRLEPIAVRRNPGDFNLKRWREGDGFQGILRCDSMAVVSDDVKHPLFAIQNWLSNRCDSLGKEDASLWNGLLLGFRRDIDPRLWEELRSTGLTHLLALSGLNIGFLAVAFIALGSLFNLNLRGRSVVALCLVIGYSLLIPDRGGTLRASIMASVLLLGGISYRWSPGMNSLGLAALMILAYRPADLFDPSFQMSFAATSGILLYQKDLSALNHWRSNQTGRLFRFIRHWIIYPFGISLAASAIVLPFTSYHFNNIALGGPLFNLVAVPLLGLVYATAWLAVLISPISSWLAELIADGAILLSLAWREVTHFFSLFAPEIHHSLPRWTIAALLLLVVWGAGSTRRVRVRYPLLLSGMLAVICLSLVEFRRPPFRVIFVDVGHGDAQIWLFPDGSTAIIDAGPASTSYGNDVVQVLHKLNRGRLDLIVASHPESDHIGGFAGIIEEFEPSLAIDNGVESSSETYIDLMKLSNDHNIQWKRVSRGSIISGLANGYTLTVLGPPEDASGRSNNDASIVLKLELPTGLNEKLGLLTTGDIEEYGEYELVNETDPSAQLLKVPHHGSRTSSTSEFIDAVNPSIAVVSRGGGTEIRSNIHRNKTLENYRQRGIEVADTKLEGAVMFEAKGDRWRRVDWRNPSFFDWLAGGY